MLYWLKGLIAACVITIGVSLAAVTPTASQEFNEIQAVIKPQLLLERSRLFRQLVRRLGRERFEQRNSPALTSSFGADLDGQAEEEISEDPKTWNLWVEGSTGRLEDTAPIRAYNGSQHSFVLGVDTQVNDTLILGLIGNYSESDVNNIFVPGNSTTEVISAGPYFAYFLTDTLILTGSFLYNWTENGATSGAVVANYDSEGWLANVSLTNYFYAGEVLLAPSIGLSFDEENDDAYVDSAATFFPASTTRNSTLDFGISASVSRTLANGVVVDPYLGIEGEWTFHQSVDAPTSVAANTEEFDASVVFGLEFQFNEGISLDVSGTYAGLAKSNYSSLTGTARLSIAF